MFRKNLSRRRDQYPTGRKILNNTNSFSLMDGQMTNGVKFFWKKRLGTFIEEKINYYW